MSITVIGGGAAGAMAAITALERGQEVILIEKNGFIGKKLRITGKGRCNLCNACPSEELIKNIPVNGRFLYSAFSSFSNKDLMSFVEGLGVPLKVERGNRVFPQSDKAQDVCEALYKTFKEKGGQLIKDEAKGVTVEDGSVRGVSLLSGKRLDSEAVILATGGKSYPVTGSNGSGYIIAQRLGHTVTELSPSLIPIVCEEKWVHELMGLSLKNVSIKITDNNGKTIFTDFGEMIFTHFGVSGPIVLSASSHMRKAEGQKIIIDLKPALNSDTLEKRLIRDFEKFHKKDFANSLDELLPKKIIDTVIRLSGILPHKKTAEITKEERKNLVRVLKEFTLTTKAFRPIDEAIITSGGINIKEINPKTMESKLVKGLFFAGEIIDVDAYTGGFNLQIAFSTGYLAGLNA